MEIISEVENVRLDAFLSEKLSISRSRIQSMIEEGKVKVNDKTIKSSYQLKQNDLITYEKYEEKNLDVEAVKMNLDIIYEDNDVIVLNKPNGLVVHPGCGNTTNTLVNGLKYYSDLSDIGGDFRPGIVHRIDAYTTGLLMIAKNNKAHEHLANQLKNKTTHRKYIALVKGVINEDSGTIDAPIGRDEKERKQMNVNAKGKQAVTHFKVIDRYKNATLIEVNLETGRTHQIRVHMKYIKHPIINDPVYGDIIDNTGQLLHAKEIGFIHPTTGKYMEFSSELPESFMNILNQFNK